MVGMSDRSVLVVEDEEAIAEAVRARLASEGYRVRVAHDGPEALRAVGEERPDVHHMGILPVFKSDPR